MINLILTQLELIVVDGIGVSNFTDIFVRLTLDNSIIHNSIQSYIVTCIVF